MKRFFVLLVLSVGFTVSVFAQTESEEPSQTKHQQFDQYFGVSVGSSGMKLNNGAVFTVDLGVSYDFYLFNWLSISAGLFGHQEFYPNTTSMVSGGNPFCFTVPLGLHFNIPKADWLYAGISFGVNIPIFDPTSSNGNVEYSKNDVFYSLPIDLGIDFIQPNKGGSRLFLRVTPTFYKSGTSVPVGIVWQIYNWRVFTPKVEVNVPPPPPPVVNIGR